MEKGERSQISVLQITEKGKEKKRKKREVLPRQHRSWDQGGCNPKGKKKEKGGTCSMLSVYIFGQWEKRKEWKKRGRGAGNTALILAPMDEKRGEEKEKIEELERLTTFRYATGRKHKKEARGGCTLFLCFRTHLKGVWGEQGGERGFNNLLLS